MAQDSGPIDFSSLGGNPTSAPTPASQTAPPPTSRDTSSGPVNFSSLGGRPTNSDVSAAATAAQTAPPEAQTLPDESTLHKVLVGGTGPGNIVGNAIGGQTGAA